MPWSEMHARLSKERLLIISYVHLHSLIPEEKSSSGSTGIHIKLDNWCPMPAAAIRALFSFNRLRTTRRSRGGAARGGGTPCATSRGTGSAACCWRRTSAHREKALEHATRHAAEPVTKQSCHDISRAVLSHAGMCVMRWSSILRGNSAGSEQPAATAKSHSWSPATWTATWHAVPQHRPRSPLRSAR